MKKYFGYIRVSTARQGERGVSLQEQREAIARYAERNQLEITTWFEEQETAAKRGRPIFNQMLKLLRGEQAVGVIIHKIDRSARNLKDWADLGELIDQGIDVHFANEALDLQSRGGRLSADIQAVVAADYIRNLREETKKGVYGRLKQGLYPMPAPIGYLNTGTGKPKAVDPITAPLVKRAFELYATGRFTLQTLAKEMARCGLMTKKGNKLSANVVSRMLNNKFYTGIIALKKTPDKYIGLHQPIVSKALFNRAQSVPHGRTNQKVVKHEHLFRMLLTCKHCHHHLTAETQKGHVYYRCHTKQCPTTGIREELAEAEIVTKLRTLEFSREETARLGAELLQFKENWWGQRDAMIKEINLRLVQLEDRLTRVTDAYLDGLLEKETFEKRRAAMLESRSQMESRMAQLKKHGSSVPDELEKFLELAGNVYSVYKSGVYADKREVVESVTSNCFVSGKNLEIMLNTPFNEVATRFESLSGCPNKGMVRSWKELFPKLIEILHTVQVFPPSAEGDRRQLPQAA